MSNATLYIYSFETQSVRFKSQEQNCLRNKDFGRETKLDQHDLKMFLYIFCMRTRLLSRQSRATSLDRIYAEVDSSLITWTEARRTRFPPYAICFSVIIVTEQN
jgi:hypothetical protein